MILGTTIPVFEQLKQFLQWFLTEIHTTTGLTWGWSIVVLTAIVRLALVPLTVKQQQSMREMQALQPEIKKIQEAHQGDRQAAQAALMEFYKEHGVNPFGSCLPMVAQIPIFIALYYSLRGDKHYKADGTPLNFLGSFVPDITESLHHLRQDHLLTLIVLMSIYVGSQMLSTLLVPSTADKTQKYLFLGMPLIFAAFIVNSGFPIGVMLYWITTNIWTVGQGAVIRKYFPTPQMQKAQADKEIERLAAERKAELKAERERQREAGEEPRQRGARQQPQQQQQKRPVRRPQKPPRQKPATEGASDGPPPGGEE